MDNIINLPSTETTVRLLDSLSPHELSELITDAIRLRKYHWGRAKLLASLAGADEDGVLNDALHETLDDETCEVLSEIVYPRLSAYLRENHWTREEKVDQQEQIGGSSQLGSGNSGKRSNREPRVF